MASSTFRSAVRRALTFWRRSIQARVVVSTVVLSAVVVSGVGWFLLEQTRQGLLEHRVDAVLTEVGTAMADANEQLDNASTTDNDADEQYNQLSNQLQARGSSRGYSLLIYGPVGTTTKFGEGAYRTQGLAIDSVPVSLQRALQRGRRHRVDLYRDPSERAGESGPGSWWDRSCSSRPTAASTRSTSCSRSTRSRRRSALVTRALVTAAALLLVLVAGLAWLVTRQVVTPVRMARRVAERLAAGQLQERVRVTGEDDLARLAKSFNQMASNLQRQIRQLEELSRVQQQFVSDVSHELRTPLTTVRMAGDVLHDARRSFDPATSRAAELLQTELDRFETLLVDLLEISRFDAGAAVLELDEVNLVDVAHRIVDQTRALADQRHTTVSWSTHPTTPAWPRPTYGGSSGSCATW